MTLRAAFLVPSAFSRYRCSCCPLSRRPHPTLSSPCRNQRRFRACIFPSPTPSRRLASRPPIPSPTAWAIQTPRSTRSATGYVLGRTRRPGRQGPRPRRSPFAATASRWPPAGRMASSSDQPQRLVPHHPQSITAKLDLETDAHTCTASVEVGLGAASLAAPAGNAAAFPPSSSTTPAGPSPPARSPVPSLRWTAESPCPST